MVRVINTQVTAVQIPAEQAEAETWCSTQPGHVYPGGGDGVVVEFADAHSATVPFGRWIVRDASDRPIDVVTTEQLATVYPEA